MEYVWERRQEPTTRLERFEESTGNNESRMNLSSIPRITPAL
jgi:hypothetical protein